MTPEQVNKNIGQMRSMFAFFGILTSLGTVLALLGITSDSSYIVAVVIWGILTACLWTAFRGLGQRSSRGYTFARICSVFFVLGFPILTFFGISYLIKLGKPQMKQAFGVS